MVAASNLFEPGQKQINEQRSTSLIADSPKIFTLLRIVTALILQLTPDHAKTKKKYTP
jgi:hypothetical protein